MLDEVFTGMSGQYLSNHGPFYLIAQNTPHCFYSRFPAWGDMIALGQTDHHQMKLLLLTEKLVSVSAVKNLPHCCMRSNFAASLELKMAHH